MNPVAVQLLNNVEKHNRSRQVATLQLQNEAQDVQSGQPNPLKRLVNHLNVLCKLGVSNRTEAITSALHDRLET
jgi:hypothetical protein